MWTPKQKEWQEADLGSQAALQGLKPANFEFLAYDFACQSTTHANMHGWLLSRLMECDCSQSALSHPSERQQCKELGLCLYLQGAWGKPRRGQMQPNVNSGVTPPSRPSRLCGFSVLHFIIQVSRDTRISSGESETQVGILAEHIHLRTSSASPKSVLHKWEPRPLH